MRILAIILGILLILLGGAYFLAFTQSGNDILKPYIEDFVSKKIEKDVKIEKFTLKTDHLSLQAGIPNEADLIVDGDIKLIDQWFNLLYHVQAQNLKTPTIIIRDKLEVDGNLKGFLSDFTATGQGKAFSSNINFDVHLVDKNPTDGNIDAKNLNIAQFLELVGKPPYTSGLLDVVAKVQNQNDNLLGNADILVHDGVINEALVKRDFNLSLPKNTSYVGKINGKVKDNSLDLTSQIVSTLATLKTTKTKINLKNMDIYSDYDLKVDELEKLAFITTKKLYGPLHVRGDVKKSKDDLLVNANSDIFDGSFNAVLNNNDLKASGQNFQIKKILALLGEPALAYGVANFTAHIDDIKDEDKNIDLDLDVKNGELVGSHLKSKFDIDFPPVTNFAGSIKANLAKNLLTASSNLQTSLANLKTKQSIYDLKSQNFSSDFDVNIEDLKHLGKIAKQDLRGSFDVKGDVSMKNKELSLDAQTNSLDGNIKASLDKGNLEAKIENASLQKIVYMLNKPNFATGDINAKAKFTGLNSKSINGNLNYKLENGILLKDGLKELTQTQVPKSYTFNMESKVDVKNSMAYFTNIINSELASLPNFKGSYDINKKILDSEYKMDIEDLSKLAFLTKQKLNGDLHVKGIAKFKDENLKFTADAPILSGQSNTDFDKGILNSKARGISIKGLCELMDFPYVFDSKGNLDLNYNTKSKQGKYSLIMKEGRMVQNQLGNLIKTFSGYDITKEIYKDTTLKGKINDTKVSYILDMNGSQTSIKISNGIYDMTSQKTKADFAIRFQKTDLGGSISGDVKNPKVKISGSNYLKNKATKEIGKKIDKYIPEKQKGLVKDILKLF
ncbi:MAG: hypothetical protein CR967_04675 [Proteobacteria bacterium]|nr:MAG: hypothetical protein CR967_04675 [Pseudomonadota bacterium]